MHEADFLALATTEPAAFPIWVLVVYFLTSQEHAPKGKTQES